MNTKETKKEEEIDNVDHCLGRMILRILTQGD
jgi:hypothetical protein